VLTSLSDMPDVDLDVKNFSPIVEFPLPLYAGQKLGVPSLLEVVEYIERQATTEVVVSTPGPVGLVVASAAKLLGIPVRGIYHTDFPAYVRRLTGSPRLEEITSGLMRRLYGACDEVLAPSRCYRRRLEDMGIEPHKLRIMPRGVDTEFFHPNRRQETFWKRHGFDQRLVFLFVGRVSQEKNIELLLSEFLDLLDQDVSAGLAIVGDGPARERLNQRFRHPSIVFTGFLNGHRLATAYASSDVFVFPSTTDTFGNAVLEAQASGLPAIVSQHGGPAEIVQRHESSLIVDVEKPGALCSAMHHLAAEPWLRCELRERAIRNAADRSWESVFDILWHHRCAADEMPGILDKAGISEGMVTSRAEVA
jgi:glycosyltransferase involved in cell wall biosynthesis